MTELTWEGKYDKDGRKVAPLRVRLPFQTVETVNESAQQRQRSLDLFGSGLQRDSLSFCRTSGPIRHPKLRGHKQRHQRVHGAVPLHSSACCPLTAAGLQCWQGSSLSPRWWMDSIWTGAIR